MSRVIVLTAMVQVNHLVKYRGAKVIVVVCVERDGTGDKLRSWIYSRHGEPSGGCSQKDNNVAVGETHFKYGCDIVIGQPVLLLG
jgi:hypothetical protein